MKIRKKTTCTLLQSDGGKGRQEDHPTSAVYTADTADVQVEGVYNSLLVFPFHPHPY